MDTQGNEVMREPQIRKLMDELFKAIAETEEQAGQLGSALVFVMQQEPPEVINEKDHERSGSCEMSDQLINAIRQVSRLENRLVSMRKRLEI